MKNTSFHIIALLAAICWMVSPPAYADWINLSGAENAANIAEIYINDDHVRIELEIFVNDMVVFDRLMPDDFFQGTGIKRPPLDGSWKIAGLELLAEKRIDPYGAAKSK
ncbi:hypothetical protein D1BOALGB6SA_7412 [Olavius sp. associated proteobacterium Delta 1]|nr:hypothetical protein D1BOALGB6SA_7412 [Olavius sp. associated proteobacterium Delta 1]